MPSPSRKEIFEENKSKPSPSRKDTAKENTSKPPPTKCSFEEKTKITCQANSDSYNKYLNAKKGACDEARSSWEEHVGMRDNMRMSIPPLPRCIYRSDFLSYTYVFQCLPLH